MLQPWSQIVIPEYGKLQFSSSRVAASHLERKPSDRPKGLDQTLLAVIGILEELKTVSNVPAWIRQGGLFRAVVTFSAFDENHKATNRKDLDPPSRTDRSTITLPSSASFVPWFHSQPVREYWTQKGEQALQRRGIPIVVNVDKLGSRSSSPMPSTPDPPSRATRHWTPSRPMSPPSESQERLRTPPMTRSQGRRHLSTVPPPTVMDMPAVEILTVHDEEPNVQPSAVASLEKGGPAQQIPGPSRSRTDAAVIEGDGTWASPSKMPPSYKTPPTDRWRSFEDREVSAYLGDLANKPGNPVSIPQQDRNILRRASQILDELAAGQSPVIRRQRDSLIGNEATVQQRLATQQRFRQQEERGEGRQLYSEEYSSDEDLAWSPSPPKSPVLLPSPPLSHSVREQPSLYDSTKPLSQKQLVSLNRQARARAIAAGSTMFDETRSNGTTHPRKLNQGQKAKAKQVRRRLEAAAVEGSGEAFRDGPVTDGDQKPSGSRGEPGNRKDSHPDAPLTLSTNNASNKIFVSPVTETKKERRLRAARERERQEELVKIADAQKRNNAKARNPTPIHKATPSPPGNEPSLSKKEKKKRLEESVDYEPSTGHGR